MLIKLKFILLTTLAMLCVGCQKFQTSQPSSAVAVAANTANSQSVYKRSQTTLPDSEKSGTVIGHAIDCDNDGRDNDYRIDYDADGIPDECISSDDDSLTIAIDTTNSQSLFDARIKLLDELTAGCTENSKVEGNITYNICTTNGQPVKAAEFLTELGDGLSIWFEYGKVKAILRTHSGEMFFFNNGKLELKFEDYGTQVVANFSLEERSEYEELALTAYQRIFQVFDID
jgi:hypothetical protein